MSTNNAVAQPRVGCNQANLNTFQLLHALSVGTAAKILSRSTRPTVSNKNRNHACPLLLDFSLRLLGLKGKSAPLPLTSAAPQVACPEALAGKTSIVKVPFTQDSRHALKQAEREYSLGKRIIVLMIEGVFFLGILPVVLVYLSSLLDTRFGLPRLDYGVINVIIGWILMLAGLLFAYWAATPYSRT